MQPNTADNSYRPLIARAIVRQHAELVAFLWSQRDDLLSQDPPVLQGIAEIKERIEANLDGLRIAGAGAWGSLLEQFEDFPDKGELFAFSWAAIEFGGPEKIAEAVEYSRGSDEDATGMVGALGWHDAHRIGPLVREWVTDRDAFKRFLSVSACLAHGVDPKILLARLVRDPDVRVRAASLRLVGVLKRADLASDVSNALADENDQTRLWSAWSLVELGHAQLARAALRVAVETPGEDILVALRAAIKAGPEKEVRAWIGKLMKSPQTASVAVRGVGMFGDRNNLAWLVERMREPAVSIAAGAALLELFPEAQPDDLFTFDMQEAGSHFAEYFNDSIVRVPLADKVAAWGRSAGLLGAG